MTASQQRPADAHNPAPQHGGNAKVSASGDQAQCSFASDVVPDGYVEVGSGRIAF